MRRDHDVAVGAAAHDLGLAFEHHEEVVLVVAGAVEHVAGRDRALGAERRELGELGVAQRRAERGVEGRRCRPWKAVRLCVAHQVVRSRGARGCTSRRTGSAAITCSPRARMSSSISRASSPPRPWCSNSGNTSVCSAITIVVRRSAVGGEPGERAVHEDLVPRRVPGCRPPARPVRPSASLPDASQTHTLCGCDSEPHGPGSWTGIEVVTTCSLW